MQIDLNTLLKTILTQANIKTLDLNDAMAIYLRSIENPETKKYYISKLRNIFNELNKLSIYNTHQITTSSLIEIKNNLIKRVKPQTCNKYIEALFTMLRYLANELDLINMPDIKYKKLDEEDFQGAVLNPDEMTSCYEYIKHNKDLRIQLIFRLLLETGIRRTEITKIKIHNIDLANQTIYLPKQDTKAKRSRYVFIMDETIQMMNEYFIIYKPQFYLFEGKPGIKYSPNSIGSIVDRIKKDLDLPNLSPHVLRRSFATYMLDNGANIISVKELLGHSTLSQTQKYCMSSIKQQKRDCLAYNPIHLINANKNE